jgi:hypothetical protein
MQTTGAVLLAVKQCSPAAHVAARSRWSSRAYVAVLLAVRS